VRVADSSRTEEESESKKSKEREEREERRERRCARTVDGAVWAGNSTFDHTAEDAERTGPEVLQLTQSERERERVGK
jgi:hypothetical protein